jgi:hypothetical protein
MHVYWEPNFIFFSPPRFTAFVPILLWQQTCSFSVIYRHISYLFVSLYSHEYLNYTLSWHSGHSFFSLTHGLQTHSTVLLFLKTFFISSFETDYQDGFMHSHLYFISALCSDFSRRHNLVSLSHFLSIFQVCSYWQCCI